MPSAWPTWVLEDLSLAPEPRNISADPETRLDVDCMILDYLGCRAIYETLALIEKQLRNEDYTQDEEEVNWQVDTVRGKERWTRSQDVALPDTHLPEDLDIKFRILSLADHLRRVGIRSEDSDQNRPSISQFGLEFRDLCLTAIARICELRWFDTTARLIIQALLDDKRRGHQQFSQETLNLYSWTPGDPERDAVWSKVRYSYLSDLDIRVEFPEQLFADNYSIEEFKDVSMTFLRDLMMVMDEPVLLQLERGKLWDLTPEETQDLKTRCGLR
ncbi:uncharacterized protein N7483_007838 [Penicillium malachiteum]|uniref:uncharacterized protein n=1 Tax=Penicillium malachiteum TaxID=1324776 RepID=UPI002548178A|nr:uncharacterized protein N7483_007838 [Penicillium malachiteum]KAJ5726481.1 hypothetical protein N7483_007838 [Penicillium malachiteum]